VRKLLALLVLECLEEFGGNRTVQNQVTRGQLDLLGCVEATALGSGCRAVVASVGGAGRQSIAYGRSARRTSHVELDVRRLLAKILCAGEGVLLRSGHGLLVWGIRRGRDVSGRHGWAAGIARRVVVVSRRQQERGILARLVVKGVGVGVILDIDVLHRIVRRVVPRRIAGHLF